MSGGYTARTGRDILDLPFHLLVDVCHHTILDRLAGNADAVQTWQAVLDEPAPVADLSELSYRVAALLADQLHRVLTATPDESSEPAGWDDVTLLRSMQNGNH